MVFNSKQVIHSQWDKGETMHIIQRKKNEKRKAEKP